jgi:hypothetical protein
MYNLKKSETMENKTGMIIVLLVVGGFLIHHLVWGVSGYFFEKLILSIKRIRIRRFFHTIKLDFIHNIVILTWVLGSLLLLLEVSIGIVVFVLISPYFFLKNFIHFLESRTNIRN